MESELKEIHNRLHFNYVDATPSNFQDFDFIIACGLPDQVDFSEINRLSRESRKCSIICFEHDGKFFMWNDFCEFSISSENGSKTFIFPSFESVLNENSSISKKNLLLDKFYEIIKGKTKYVNVHDFISNN